MDEKKLNKKELIQKLSSVNVLRSKASWNKSSKADLESMYFQGLELGILK